MKAKKTSVQRFQANFKRGSLGVFAHHRTTSDTEDVSLATPTIYASKARCVVVAVVVVVADVVAYREIEYRGTFYLGEEVVFFQRILLPVE